MQGIGARSLGYFSGVLTLVVLGWILTGQAAGPVKKRVSLPTDWSHRHVVFSNPTNAQEYARVASEPRYMQQLYRREYAAGRAQVVPALAVNGSAKKKTVPSKNALHRDWAVNLGFGASMGPGNYPAKFGFDVTKADCAADYVVYSTGLLGAVNQASIVGFSNLYSGCGGAVPKVNWAYNTDAGLILTSPITSLDGTQIAFVQTSGSPTGIADLVLLKWAASATDTVSSPTTLTGASNVSNGAYRACTAPCMTTIRLRTSVADGGIAVDDRTSSVFYDYKNDIIWVGGALGWVHKFTGVFNGTPAADTTVFPVQVAASTWTSSAVYDRVSNNVFVGDALGVVYAVNATTGAVTASGQLDFGTGIVDAPIIDQTGGFLYLFASADSGSGLCPLGGSCAAVYQLSTTFSAGDFGAEVGVGDSSGTPTPMFIGGFDSTYYRSANRTGNLYVCGNNGFAATLYQVPITAGAFPGSGQGSLMSALATVASSAGCSSVTDVNNPNTAIGPAERVFVSVQNNGRYSTCSGTGCLVNFVVAEWKPSTTYVAGQQILSSKLHVETVVTGGTSGATTPVWTNTAAATKADGSVLWIDQGTLPPMATVIGWQASHTYGSLSRIIDSNGNVQVSTAGTSGTPNPPSWSTTIGATTADGTVTWKNAGFSGTFALPSAGGTSGIIEDNVVSPLVQPGASQVYFTTLANQACGATGTGGCAVQASQPALK